MSEPSTKLSSTNIFMVPKSHFRVAAHSLGNAGLVDEINEFTVYGSI